MATITKKQKIVAIALSVILVFYALLGFYVLPELARSKLPGLLTEKFGLQVELQAVAFNPFSFELEVNGFSLHENAAKPLFAFERFAVNFNLLSSLLEQAVVFDSIALNKPVTNIKRLANGEFNFSRMLAQPGKQPEPKQETVTKQNSGLLPLLVRQLSIDEGHIAWLDQSGGQEQSEAVLPLSVSIVDLGTKSGKEATFNLGFKLASGGHLQWQGDFSLSPLASKGLIHLEGLELPKVWQLFLQKALPVEIAEGLFTLNTEYQVSHPGKELELNISKTDIEIKQLGFTEKGGKEPLLSFPDLAIRGISADFGKHLVNIATVSSKDAVFRASLLKDGRLNYQALFAKPGSATTPAPDMEPTPVAASPDTAPVPASAPAPAAAAAPVWQISIGELALHGYQLLFSDQTREPPQVIKLSGMNLDMHDFTTQQGVKLPVQFSTKFNDDGNIKIDGDVSLQPFSAALNLDIKTIKLKNFQNYLNDYVKLDFVEGDANCAGSLNIQPAAKLQLTFLGNANLANLLTRDRVNNKDFLKWVDLQLQQIEIDSAAQRVNIANVVLNRPFVKVNINKDRSSNIKEILPTGNPGSKDKPPKADPKTMQPPPANPEQLNAANPEVTPVINIGKILLQDGHSDFADYSLILPFIADMDDLNGEVNGFSSLQDTPLKLSLKGTVYNMARVQIIGSYQLGSGDSKINLKFTQMPLPLITPYMVDFAGYKIEKGQMALDLQYTVTKGELAAQNKIFIDQLTLGDKIENPHATSLPLQFAIALLKDADGKINLDFPVTGSLNDPQFSVGALIADVLGNLIEKLVASPFKALGSLLSDDSDYTNVAFAPGRSELNANESAELDQLANALQSRSELTLDIKGTASQVLDWPELRFDVVVEVLKKMKSSELRDKGEKIRSEYIELSEDDYKRLLAKFFNEVFPGDMETSLLGGPRIKSQPDAEFYGLALQRLEAKMQPEPQRLNDLAVARASRISRYLIEKNGLEPSRLYILAPEILTDKDKGINSVLSLNVAH